MIEVGSVCVKTSGREAGKYCVVVEKPDKGFTVVTGPKDLTGVRRRKVNLEHIEATGLKVKIAEKAQDAEVERTYTDEILKKLKIEKKAAPVKKTASGKESV